MSMTLTPEVLSKYKNRIFVETGTNIGGGVQLALDIGFDKIYSIEKNENLYKISDMRFIDNPSVAIFLGDSKTILPGILEYIEEPATFWLDAHIDPDETDTSNNNPLLEELDIIGKHKLNTHTLLIDDRPQMGKNSNNWYGDSWVRIKEEEVLDKIKQINPSYKITFEDNKFTPEAIIVAVL